MLQAEDYPTAWERFDALADEAKSYSDVSRLVRPLQRLVTAAPRPKAKRLKVALMGNATTETLEGPLRVALHKAGFGVELYQAPYNTATWALLAEESPATRFRPDITVVVNSPANLPAHPAVHASVDEVEAQAQRVVDDWLKPIAIFHERTGSEVVIDNLHPLPLRPHGNLEAKLPWSGRTFVDRINRLLSKSAPPYVHINDVAALASWHGLQRWFDARFWFHAKQPVSFECTVPYTESIARIVASVYGRTAKCLVLDLDNTLWGGVVGDDGYDGIKIGQGDPVGEAHLQVQAYALQLKARGIMLAVCSKNYEANAKEPFEKREDMLIKLDDLVAFKANWGPKPDNIRAIAHELNIGLDSFVFLDDNPAEREIVRRTIPEVRVVEVGDDPAEYATLLDATGWFEVTRVSAEDLQRTEQYQANAKRAAALTLSSGDYEAYLRSLEQLAVVGPFAPPHLDRITQLINKSNQFNLTTRRMARSEVEAEMVDPNRLTAYVRLRDRFGDNGLICVFSAHKIAETVRIDQWLMSCRVLNRGVERLLTNLVAERARALGAKVLEGIYLPTAKNALVVDHYEKLGFTAVTAEPDMPAGATRWQLDLDAFQPFSTTIDVVDSY